MRIGIVGGIYGKSEAFRRALQFTPESILENGLAAAGHQVATLSHYAAVDTRALDVVHVHHLSYGALRMATDVSPVPFVYTGHDVLAMAGLQGKLRQRAAEFVMSRADAVVALSQREAALQRDLHTRGSALHTVIPNGIVCENFHYARRNAAGKDGVWRLLFVGQLIQEKRVDLLLEALPRLQQPCELDLVFHTRTLEACLRKMVEDLGLQSRVRFLGPRCPRELSAIYQGADVLVLPSAGEALPSVVSEAMLCGTPVVATDVGGIREQLGPFGIVVPPGSATALADAINHMLTNYSKFAAMGEAMSRSARERFSTGTMVQRHLELYAAVIRQGAPRRCHAVGKMPVNALLRAGVALLCATK